MTKLLSLSASLLVACMSTPVDNDVGAADTNGFDLFSITTASYLGGTDRIIVTPLTTSEVACGDGSNATCEMDSAAFSHMPTVTATRAGDPNATLLSARHWRATFADPRERDHGYDVEFALVGSLANPSPATMIPFEHYLLTYQARTYTITGLGRAHGEGEVKEFRLLTADDPRGERTTSEDIKQIKSAAREDASPYGGMVVTGNVRSVEGGVRLDIAQMYPFELRTMYDVPNRDQETPDHP